MANQAELPLLVRAEDGTAVVSRQIHRARWTLLHMQNIRQRDRRRYTVDVIIKRDDHGIEFRLAIKDAMRTASNSTRHNCFSYALGVIKAGKEDLGSKHRTSSSGPKNVTTIGKYWPPLLCYLEEGPELPTFYEDVRDMVRKSLQARNIHPDRFRVLMLQDKTEKAKREGCPNDWLRAPLVEELVVDSRSGTRKVEMVAEDLSWQKAEDIAEKLYGAPFAPLLRLVMRGLTTLTNSMGK
ncbi:Uu.00g072890.m01.CDS01 [Anthostomella pinea]|uniref:Uu.00g072890.m01.CDS01 n=1 Tax=Anthostomella pinea TaxID=933095 RepID=A0AAI8VV73_9PEZI|nr:Uu.00g072890.m01.CDS01 [Anthostomella pinea]